MSAWPLSIADHCAEHGQPLDPWGLCHHGCGRCAREAPFERIWTHKGTCRSVGAPVLVRDGWIPR